MKCPTLLVATANVFGFRLTDYDPAPLLQALYGLARPTDDAVVFCLQEAWNTRKQRTCFEHELPGYMLYDDVLDATFCGFNLMAIRHQGPAPSMTICKLPQHLHPRTALIASCSLADTAAPPLRIAGTHLMGGKYDSEEWFAHCDARTEQLAAIAAYQPTIIMGDFNADSQYDDLREVPYWKERLPLGEKAGLTLKDLRERYLMGGHKLLQQQGYRSLFDRSTMTTTTPFNVVADWIYLNTRLLQPYQVKSIETGIVPAREQGLSDHDFLWARLTLC